MPLTGHQPSTQLDESERDEATTDTNRVMNKSKMAKSNPPSPSFNHTHHPDHQRKTRNDTLSPTHMSHQSSREFMAVPDEPENYCNEKEHNPSNRLQRRRALRQRLVETDQNQDEAKENLHWNVNDQFTLRQLQAETTPSHVMTTLGKPSGISIADLEEEDPRLTSAILRHQKSQDIKPNESSKVSTTNFVKSTKPKTSLMKAPLRYGVGNTGVSGIDESKIPDDTITVTDKPGLMTFSAESSAIITPPSEKEENDDGSIFADVTNTQSDAKCGNGWDVPHHLPPFAEDTDSPPYETGGDHMNEDGMSSISLDASSCFLQSSLTKKDHHFDDRPDSVNDDFHRQAFSFAAVDRYTLNVGQSRSPHAGQYPHANNNQVGNVASGAATCCEMNKTLTVMLENLVVVSEKKESGIHPVDGSPSWPSSAFSDDSLSLSNTVRFLTQSDFRHGKEKEISMSLTASAKPLRFLAKDIITVVEPQKLVDSKTTFVSYGIRVGVSRSTSFPISSSLCDLDPNQDLLTTVHRRYSEFESFRNELAARYPFVVIPPIPEKHSFVDYTRVQRSREELELVHRRRRFLQSFLNRLCVHPILAKEHLFHQFLQVKNWASVIQSEGIVAMSPGYPMFQNLTASLSTALSQTASTAAATIPTLLSSSPLSTSPTGLQGFLMPLPPTPRRLRAWDVSIRRGTTARSAHSYPPTDETAELLPGEATDDAFLEFVQDADDEVYREAGEQDQESILASRLDSWCKMSTSWNQKFGKAVGQLEDGLRRMTKRLKGTVADFEECSNRLVQYANTERCTDLRRIALIIGHALDVVTLNTCVGISRMEDTMLEPLQEHLLYVDAVRHVFEKRADKAKEHTSFQNQIQQKQSQLCHVEDEIAKMSADLSSPDRSSTPCFPVYKTPSSTLAASLSSSQVIEIVGKQAVGFLSNLGQSVIVSASNALVASGMSSSDALSTRRSIPLASAPIPVAATPEDIANRRTIALKLRANVADLQEARKKTLGHLTHITEVVHDDIEVYDARREHDLRQAFLSFARSQVELHRQNLKEWEEAVEALSATPLPTPPGVSTPGTPLQVPGAQDPHDVLSSPL